MRPLLASRFVRRVAVLAGGAAVGRAIVVLAAPLLTRLYTPDDFGVVGVYGALLEILGTIVCLRYEFAVPLPASDRMAANLVVLCLVVAGLLALLAAVVVWSLAEPLTTWLNVPALRPYLWLLPPGLFGVGAYQALSYWSIRRRAFPRLAYTRVAQGVGQVGVQLGLGMATAGPVGLLLGAWVGETVGVTNLAAAARRDDRQAFRTVRPRNLWRMMRRYRRFPLFSSGSALLNATSRQLPALLLAALYGPQVAGWYALVRRVMQVPMTLVGGAVAQVYMSEAASLARADVAALRPLVLRLVGRLLLVGAIPMAAVALGGPWLFEVVFGAGWDTAGDYAQILSFMFLAQLAIAPVVQTLQILERQHIHLLWSGAQILGMAVVFACAYSFDWSAWWLLGAYSVAMSISYGGALLLVLSVIQSRPSPASAS